MAAVITKAKRHIAPLPRGARASGICPRCGRLGLYYEQEVGETDISCFYCGYRVSKVVVRRLVRYKKRGGIVTHAGA